MNKLTISRSLTILSYLGLLAALFAAVLAGGSEKTEGMSIGIPMFIWAVLSVPLFIFIPGLISGSHKQASWLSYVSMIYFIGSILVFFTPRGELWGGLMVLSTLTLFITTILYTRWKKAEEKT
ncbi:MAG: DUF2069 domain-containing protein [Oleispira sp.]|jgi:uncharacterized membrane protein|nr:DUF2069 domain-containing protein [Oleispira sp.]